MYFLDIVKTPPEEAFDRMTRIVASIFEMPIALISLVTSQEQWFKSCVGLEVTGSDRQSSFCQYVVADKRSLVVEDTLKDSRFAHNKLVTGYPGIRFYAGAPLVTSQRNLLGSLCLIDHVPRHFSEDQMKLLQEFADLAVHEMETRAKLRELKQVGADILHRSSAMRQLSMLDPLTNVFNRRYFDELLDRELERAAREQQPLSLILIDVDHFKAYNDTYGHPEGDRCLIQVSHAIRDAIHRPVDLLARFGGEEFAVLLPKIGSEAAQIVASQIQEAVAKLAIPHTGSSTASYVTVSQGVCSVRPAHYALADKKELLELADKELYRSKLEGRNTVRSVRM